MSSKSQTILPPQVRLSLFRRVGIAQLVERLHAWSRTVRQQRHNICQIRTPPIPARTYGEENGSAASCQELRKCHTRGESEGMCDIYVSLQ